MMPFENDFLFSGIPPFMSIFFILTISLMFLSILKGIKRWNYNNSQPVLSVTAKIVSRRQDTTHHTHTNSDGMSSHTSYSTSYYATFEVESGDRMEFKISGSQYGLMSEGDYGKLTFQGTRFLCFDRSYQNTQR